MNPVRTATETRASAAPASAGPLPWSARLLTVRVETVCWMVLLAAALVSRLAGLGTRAMSHDESLHALYSYYLYDGRGYAHNPMMHGPLLFHANALVYLLLGDSDFTARLLPALVGVGVVMMAWLFRRYIGRTAALVLGVLLAIDPGMLFYSRYIRNDIYVCLLSMVWIWGAFRYLDTGHRKWVSVMVTGMALTFITKEVSFIHGGIIGAFFVGLAAWQHLAGRRPLWANPAGDLAILMLTLVLPFAAPIGHVLLGWDPMDKSTAGVVHAAVTVGIAATLSGAVGIIWFGVLRQQRESDPGRSLTPGVWCRAMALFWVIQVLFFTTFFTNFRNGLLTGVVGSVGYWLAQQEVQRGGQPWFYYILLSGAYAFLPWVLSIGGAVCLGRGLARRGWAPVPQGDLPPAAERDEGSAENRTYFIVFVLWWALSSWAAYSAAGERMPWLLTHIVLPMCFLGSWWLGRTLVQFDWTIFNRPGTRWLVLAAAGGVLLVALIPYDWPVRDRQIKSVAVNMQWWRFALVIAGVGIAAASALLKVGRRAGRRACGLGLLAAAVVLTFRAAVMLAFVNYDLANELLVYAHGTPDIKRALRRIDLVRQRGGLGGGKLLAYDSESSWPLTWYFRHTPYLFYGEKPTGDIKKIPVVLAGPKTVAAVRRLLGSGYTETKYLRIWWPPEGYKRLTPAEVARTLTSGSKLNRLRLWFFHRRYPGLVFDRWPQRGEFFMFVRRGPGAAAGGPQVAGIPWRRIHLRPTGTFAGRYAGKSLRGPRDVAVGPDAVIAIADTGNDRVVLLDASGRFLRAFGSSCKLRKNNQGCRDPDGVGPLQPGDGQFDGPWGVAVGPEGDIYVADTWNGRIQVFDRQGRFLRKWGRFGDTGGKLKDPLMLYGPRGLVIEPNGGLLVTDTGNERVIRFGRDGSVRRQVGGEGAGRGRFQEPVGIAIDPGSGDVLVADTWNQRIQRLSASLRVFHDWPVPDWTSRAAGHKPFLAIDDDGLIYASDPQGCRIMVFGPWGGQVAEFGSRGAGPTQFNEPTGLAFDRTNQRLLVADAGNNRVLAFAPIGGRLGKRRSIGPHPRRLARPAASRAGR